TQLKGVTPDIPFPSALAPGEYGEAEEENALPWDKVPVAQYGTLNEIYPELIQNLDGKHQQRIKTDVEFSYIFQDIAEFKESHNDKTVSLVESERLAERDDNDKKQLDRVNERRVREGLEIVKSLDDIEDDTEKTDAFLDETAYITLDLVDVEKVAKNQK
ncbi:MAG: carboxyl-terminal processing protease, partial [Shewanella sp.]